MTLARLLQVAHIPIEITIFELDASPHARTSQGGTLDLHPPDGLLALERAGLLEKARPFLRYEGEELVFADKNATEYVHLKESPRNIKGFEARPEIDRERLKEVLLESVDPDCVRWGKHLKSVDGEKGLLHFEEGEPAGPFDLIVGADGAWSKVRHVLTDVRPRYSGVCGFEGQIMNPKENYPVADKMVGRGSYFAYSGGKSITAQRMGNDSIKVGMWAMKDETHLQEVMGEKGLDPVSLKKRLCKLYDDWDESMKGWIRSSEKFKTWVLYELPVGHTWQHRAGFTLIGDAAHLVTPFAGQGVNAAMKDALELCDLIVQSVKEGTFDLDEAVRKYEMGMFPRARKVQEATMRNKVHMFRNDAPLGFMVKMVDVMAMEKGFDAEKGLTAVMLLPVKIMVYSYLWSVATLGSLRRIWRNISSRT